MFDTKRSVQSGCQMTDKSWICMLAGYIEKKYNKGEENENKDKKF